MEEQISIIITILSALLTGGFLMIFIESQQVTNKTAERFHLRLRPFFHSFNSYLRFIASFKSCFSFNNNSAGYMKDLKTNVDKISHLGGKSIISGQEYPTDYFTADQLDSICETINNIWHCIDKDYHGFKEIYYDIHYAENFSEYTIKYLEEISPKYKGMKLKKELLGQVSGDFYVESYKQIEHVLPQYEYWQKKEKEFKIFAFLTVTITLMTMMLILLMRYCIPMWVLSLLCVLCCSLLIFELYKLMRLEDLS